MMKRMIATILLVALLAGMLACAGCGELPPEDTNPSLKESDPVETKPNDPKPQPTRPTPTDPTTVTPAPTEPGLTDPAETKPVETKPIETKPTETKPTETKPVETKPVETKPVETKPAETKPVETKPAETKPVETDPPETKPVETKPAETKPTETVPPPTEPAEVRIAPMQYPENALKDLGLLNLKLKSFIARAAQGTSYQGNTHYDGTNLSLSPYFEATVEGTALPVYGTPVYVADGDYGALHSFASVDVDFGDQGYVTIELQVNSLVSVKSAEVFCHDAAELSVNGRTITLQVKAHGVYTVVLNDEQDYAVTIFVREYRDEEEEIAAYRAQYGAERVIVYEPGLHEISYLNLSGNSVLYLKAGAILLPKHTFDIQDDAAAANTAELNATQSNGIGLNRFPVINTYAASNVTIAGRGTVDMTQLDWHERRGIVFTQCKNITMDGVIIINPCEWAFITYRCENVTVTQSAVLGYRTNSDAFAICNTIGAQVTDCFARTGDDMFEVKTLGGVDGAVSRDITYRRCQAWGSKARCFGVIGEIEKDISNILFEDGIVIFRDAIWDNNRIGSLVVLRETGNGMVDGITFRNMTIHFDKGRPIQVGVYSNQLEGSKMQNILFENISYNAKMSGQLRKNSGAGNYLKVTFKNVTANGTKLTSRNAGEFIYWDVEGLLTVQ